MEKTLKQEASVCIKIVLFGPESTGKTTLSKQLAKHYNSERVPEYLRSYSQNKWDNEQKICNREDVLPIAQGQMALENKGSKIEKTLLICDTNLLETKVYSEAYFDYCDPLVEKYALENTYDLYFLTYIDTPWQADDLRDKPHEREHMFKLFEVALKQYNKPYIVLKGSKETRLKMAIKTIDNLIKNNTLEIYRERP